VSGVQIQLGRTIGWPQPWQPNAIYVPGASVTPQPYQQAAYGPRPSPAIDTIVLPQYQFVCLTGGKSGPSPPVWATKAGVQVQESGGGPLWLCLGIFPT
jgi:hypothetical protein